MKSAFAVAGVLCTLAGSNGCGGAADDRTPPVGSDDAAGDAGPMSDGAFAEATDESNAAYDAASDAGNGVLDARGDDAWVGSQTSDADPDASFPECPIGQTTPVSANTARSAGYSGVDAAYYALYGGSCQVAGDCVPACVVAGGTSSSCASGSQCQAGQTADGGFGCLPPTYWLRVSGALSESATMANAAQVILVTGPFDDGLLLTNFGIAIPDDAVVTGLQFSVRRASLAGNAVDGTVQLVRDGTLVGPNHALAEAWPTTFIYATYGGAYDLWGNPLTPMDLRSSSLGVSIAPKYTGPPTGNERAYVDSVRLTVFYQTPCE